MLNQQGPFPKYNLWNLSASIHLCPQDTVLKWFHWRTVSAWKAKGIMQQAASKFACGTNLRGLKKKKKVTLQREKTGKGRNVLVWTTANRKSTFPKNTILMIQKKNTRILFLFLGCKKHIYIYIMCVCAYPYMKMK